MLRRTLVILALAILSSLVSNTAFGGGNAKGRAWLSWDPAGLVSEIGRPQSSKFPLYLHISDAPDIHSLAVNLRWSTGDSEPCYKLISSPSDKACGWATDTSPGGDFEGDKTYTWSIWFDPGSAKSCVVYTFSSVACAPPASASFLLASVLTKDGSGAVDSLMIQGQASIASFLDLPPASKEKPLVKKPYAPNQIIVWFKPGNISLPAGETDATIGGTSFLSEAVRFEMAAVGGTRLRMLTPTATMENLVAVDPDSQVIQLDKRQLDMYVVALSDTNVVGACASLLRDSTHIISAQPDWMLKTALEPNDPLYGWQWWLENTGQANGEGGQTGWDIRAPAAWDTTTGGPYTGPSAVVVIDTGCDLTHPEFSTRIVQGPNYVEPGQPPLDFDGSGGSGLASGHGTAMAGIIGAQGNNGVGVAGVNWNATIVVVRACQFETCASSNVLAAIDWARTNGYRIVNASIADFYMPVWDPNDPNYAFSRAAETVYKNAWSAGMVVFTASGNDNSESRVYPAGYDPFTTTVGAIWADGLRWDETALGYYWRGSNYGAHLWIMAPGGTGITTTASRDNPDSPSGYTGPGTGTSWAAGTSAACAAASGVTSLVASVAPGLTGEDLAQVIALTARDLYAQGRDPLSGWGLIDAHAAVARVSGENILVHGAQNGGTSGAETYAGLRTVLSWPGITPGLYYAWRRTIMATIFYDPVYPIFCGTPPTVWPRLVSSYGVSDMNPIMDHYVDEDPNHHDFLPEVWVVTRDAESITMATNIYRLVPFGGGSTYWWPTTSSGVRCAFTAIGSGMTEPVVGVPEQDEEYGLIFTGGVVRNVAEGRVVLPNAARVEASVYDVAGRTTRRLMDETRDRGVHKIVWRLDDDHGVPVKSGVYFVRLRVGSRSSVARLVVLR